MTGLVPVTTGTREAQSLRVEHGETIESFISGLSGQLVQMADWATSGEYPASHHSLNIIPLSLHFPPASHGKWTVKDKSEASMSGKQLFWSELKLLSCDGNIRSRDKRHAAVITDHLNSSASVGFSFSEERIFS